MSEKFHCFCATAAGWRPQEYRSGSVRRFKNTLLIRYQALEVRSPSTGLATTSCLTYAISLLFFVLIINGCELISSSSSPCYVPRHVCILMDIAHPSPPCNRHVPGYNIVRRGDARPPIPNVFIPLSISALKLGVRIMRITSTSPRRRCACLAHPGSPDGGYSRGRRRHSRSYAGH